MPTSARSTRKNNFTKSERLCSRKAIEALFAGGNRSCTAFPLRVVFRIVSDETATVPAGLETVPAKILISVSKRHFKHAVDRNRAKRQLREAWRLNRYIITDGTSLKGQEATGLSCHKAQSLHIAFLWLADEPQSSELVQRKMKNLLHRIKENLCSDVS
ncbi:MAG: ribonuclease P protein component [Bacteroidaceae bacterium]|nr:ribonuclease P protein component [Bacteroidaceae bacterium]